MTGRNAEILKKYLMKDKTVNISTFDFKFHAYYIIIIVLQELEGLTTLQSKKLHVTVKDKKVITWKRNTNCKLQFLVSINILSILMKDRT